MNWLSHNPVRHIHSRCSGGGTPTNFDSLTNSAESNIVLLFRKFRDKPAVFLSKSDVMCYMYCLLLTDSSLGRAPTITNFSTTVQKSKTFLVHAGLNVSIQEQSKQVALSLGEFQKETDLPVWDFPIGIEIQHNLKGSPEDIQILTENVRKLSSFKRGYLLWLNWGTQIPEESIKVANGLTEQNENLRFNYIDLCQQPPKSNLKI